MDTFCSKLRILRWESPNAVTRVPIEGRQRFNTREKKDGLLSQGARRG